MLTLTAHIALAVLALVLLVLVLKALESCARLVLRWTGTGRPIEPAPQGRCRGPRAGRIEA